MNADTHTHINACCYTPIQTQLPHVFQYTTINPSWTSSILRPLLHRQLTCTSSKNVLSHPFSRIPPQGVDRTRSRARSNSPNPLYRPHSRPHSHNGRYSQFDQQQQQQRKSAHDVKAAAFLVNKWLMDCVQELGDPPVLALIYVPRVLVLVLALCPCPCAYPHISPLSFPLPPYHTILSPPPGRATAVLGMVFWITDQPTVDAPALRNFSLALDRIPFVREINELEMLHKGPGFYIPPPRKTGRSN